MSLLEASKSLLAISKSNVMQYTDSVKSEDKKKYIDGDEIRKKIAELDAATEAKYEERRKQREIQKESLRMRREIATTNNFDTVVNADDKIITLSTCSSNNRRFVLHAVKIID